jgi:hypothetical protein
MWLSGISMAIALAVGGCDSSVGAEGEGCRSTGILGHYECDDGLVCNEARATATCEKRQSNPLGTACSQNDNCVEGLWCNHNLCSKPLAEGEACPQGLGCAAGLACVKDGPAPITCQKAP